MTETWHTLQNEHAVLSGLVRILDASEKRIRNGKRPSCVSLRQLTSLLESFLTQCHGQSLLSSPLEGVYQSSTRLRSLERDRLRACEALRLMNRILERETATPRLDWADKAARVRRICCYRIRVETELFSAPRPPMTSELAALKQAFRRPLQELAGEFGPPLDLSRLENFA